MMRQDRRRSVITTGGIAVTLVVLLVPWLPLIIWAFSQRGLYPALLPMEWELRGWTYLLSPGVQLGKAFGSSLAIGLGVVALSLVLGIPAGRALGMYRVRGRALVELLVMSPLLVPSFAPIMGIQIAFIRAGLANSLLGVILAHLIPVLPYVVLLLSGVFANYSPELEQAARTLGAGTWTIFWRVMLPMVAPGIAITGLLALAISWGQYLLTLIVGGGEILTLPMMLASFIGSGDYAVSAAVSLVLALPMILALLVTSWYVGGQDVLHINEGNR